MDRARRRQYWDLRRGQGQPRAQGFAMRFRAVGPVGLDRIPEFLQSLLVGVAILDHEGGDCARDA